MAVAHKGSISMSLVLIPVGLHKTTVDNDIHFNQLDKESGAWETRLPWILFLSRPGIREKWTRCLIVQQEGDSHRQQ